MKISKTGQFKAAYLLYGDEDYLKKQYRGQINQSPHGAGRYHELCQV